MAKLKLFLLVGCSGSGKSTYASQLVFGGAWGEVNRDFWRFSLFTNGVKDWSLYKFTKERENIVTHHCENTFYGLVAAGQNIIVSNTNLNQRDHDYWRAKADEVGYEFEVKYFPATLSELLKRDKKRGALAVGQDVLFDQWEKWLKITDARKYEPDETKPKIIICDIDSTIAITTTRSHYDYSDAVLTDKPRWDVMLLVESFARTTGADVICVSGRSDICKEHTQKWLKDYSFDHIALHMRKDKDSRSDCIVKEEIFWQEIAPYYNVIAAFDDRKKIIRKWHDVGVPLVIDVSTTYKEF